jgi:hypothetical protein
MEQTDVSEVRTACIRAMNHGYALIMKAVRTYFHRSIYFDDTKTRYISEVFILPTLFCRPRLGGGGGNFVFVARGIVTFS